MTRQRELQHRRTTRHIRLLRFPMSDFPLDGDSFETAQSIDTSDRFHRLFDEVQGLQNLGAGRSHEGGAKQQRDDEGARRE